MIIALQKKQENITEYILYMWQIEDLIRACKFDMELINENIISRFDVEPPIREKIEEWYENIVNEMLVRGLQKTGHLDEVYEILNELTHLHITLTNVLQNKEYQDLVTAAAPSIRDIQRKAPRTYSDVEACLNGLYGVLLLRLQNKEISEDTLQAVNNFNTMLAKLAWWYKEMKAGRLNLPRQNQN